MSSSGAGPTVSEYFGSITPVTKALLVLNIGTHIMIFLSSFPVMALAINEHLVIEKCEYYRVVSSAFVHGGIFHIFMNMSSLLQLGLSLELQFGSLQFLFFTVWTIFINGFLYCALCYAMFIATGDNGEKYVSGIGYSGVLFAYAIIESYHTTEQSRSVFGIFTVPAKVYPFILLLLIQVLLPGISFFGHLAGVLTGLLTVSGIMQLVLPSHEFLLLLERRYGSSCALAALARMGHYVPHGSSKSLVHPSFVGTSASQCARSVCSGANTVLLHVWQMLSLLPVIFLPAAVVARCGGSCDRAAAAVAGVARSLANYSAMFASRATTAGSAANLEEGVAMNPLSARLSGRGGYAPLATGQSQESPSKEPVLL